MFMLLSGLKYNVFSFSAGQKYSASPRYHRWSKCSQPSSSSEGICVGQSLLQPHAPLFTSGCVSVLGSQPPFWLWPYEQNSMFAWGASVIRTTSFRPFFKKAILEKNSLQAFCYSFSWICITLGALFVERQRISIQLTQCMIERGVQTLTRVTKENKLSSSSIHSKWLERQKTFPPSLRQE